MNLNPPPKITFESNKPWKNKHLTVQGMPERIYDAWNRRLDGPNRAPDRWRAGLNVLRQIVIDAQDAKKRVHAVGGMWSLSNAAFTRDFLVMTRNLNFLDIGFDASNVLPGCRYKKEELVFAQCGVQVRELNQELERKGLSLPTSGASNGQTICGAVSTGTHGSANQVGSMQDYVVGLHIVAENGDHYWIERETDQVVSDDFVDKIGARLRRNDELFNAAVVSFGSFGLVHGMLLHVEPLYYLETYRHWYNWPDVYGIIGTLDLGSLKLPQGDVLPFHFEVLVNPYKTGGQQRVVVRSMYKKTPSSLDGNGNHSGRSAKGTPQLGEGALAFIGKVMDVAPRPIPVAVGTFLTKFFGQVGRKIGTHGQTFGGTKIQGAAYSTEIGVALENVPRVMDGLLDIAQKHPFPGILALRYVPRSKASLAFTRFDMTCTIEIPCPPVNSCTRLLRARMGMA